MGCQTFVLDGDNVRHGLCRDLGFSQTDRQENIRRVGEVAKLMMEAGVITLVALISPFRADRDRVRQSVAPGDFIEIYCDCDLAVCEQRDPKGLYKKARRREIGDFTGISSPYEPPEQPELRVDTGQVGISAAVAMVLDVLENHCSRPENDA